MLEKSPFSLLFFIVFEGNWHGIELKKKIKTLGSLKGLCSCIRVVSMYCKGGTYIVCGMISDKLTRPSLPDRRQKPRLTEGRGKGGGVGNWARFLTCCFTGESVNIWTRSSPPLSTPQMRHMLIKLAGRVFYLLLFLKRWRSLVRCCCRTCIPTFEKKQISRRYINKNREECEWK